MFDKHPVSEYKAHFRHATCAPSRWSPAHLPTHYTGDDGYVSDTETSVVWNNEHVKTDWDRAKSQKMREQQALSREAKNIDVLQSPLARCCPRRALRASGRVPGPATPLRPILQTPGRLPRAVRTRRCPASSCSAITCTQAAHGVPTVCREQGLAPGDQRAPDTVSGFRTLEVLTLYQAPMFGTE